MGSRILKFVFSFILISFFILPYFIFAKESKLEIYFFYSSTCPHCRAEMKFLDSIEEKYPDIKIGRYLTRDPNYKDLMAELLKKHNAEKYTGLVPLTFVGEVFFLGFDNSQGIGKDIEESIKRQLDKIESKQEKKENVISLPIIGEINVLGHSLIFLSVVLGLFDGFNICSLGALALILGLVLVFRSRKKILFFGGLYILTTSIIYVLLISLWYKLFSYLSGYIRFMEIVIGSLGIIGAIYLLKEFVRFKKYGPQCDIGNSFITKSSNKLRKLFDKSRNIFVIASGVLLFSAIITIIEFPCSAVIPVMFAGILSNAHLSFAAYFFYMLIYILFYMFDELIIFFAAVFKMSVWMTSPKFVTWITFAGAIILGILGVYYLFI